MAQSGTMGWVYEPASGKINANTNSTEFDAKGVAYNRY